MLLTDTFILENLEVIEESKSKGTMKIRGCFQRADEANNNKRVYTKVLLERELVKLDEAVKERRLLGELDHPSHDAVKLSNVSHLVTGLKMVGKEVVGEAEILNTPAGKVAQALINDGVKIGISSRGMGTLSDGLTNGCKQVNEDFKLITFDLVADPSTRGAFPQLSESTSHRTQEIVESTFKKASKEKYFLTLLKKKLYETVGKDPHEGEPEHLAAIRRANMVSSDIKSGAKLAEAGERGKPVKKKVVKKPGKRQDSGTSYGETLVRKVLEGRRR